MRSLLRGWVGHISSGVVTFYCHARISFGGGGGGGTTKRATNQFKDHFTYKHKTLDTLHRKISPGAAASRASGQVMGGQVALRKDQTTTLDDWLSTKRGTSGPREKGATFKISYIINKLNRNFSFNNIRLLLSLYTFIQGASVVRLCRSGRRRRLASEWDCNLLDHFG